jgi:hypothetical protein
MNAKKISTLLLCSAGIAMLAACSGKTVSRADAETKLGAMDTAVNASDYKLPTKATYTTKKDGTTTYELAYDTDAIYVHSKYYAAVTSKDANSSTVTVKNANAEVWAYKDGSTYVVAYTDGTSGKIYITGSDAVSDAVITTAITAAATKQSATYSATLQATPKKMQTWLKDFDDSTKSTVSYASGEVGIAGGTIKGKGFYMKSEAYKSSGDGNLEMNMVIGRSYGDETCVYNFDKNMILENDTTSGGSTTAKIYSWGTCTIAKTSITTTMTAAEAVIYVATLAF